MNEQRKPEAPPKAASDLAPAPGTKLALAADFGTVYVKVNNGQLMRPIKASMQLFEKLGHFYSMPGKWDPATGKSDKKYPITSAGYTHLNKVASISIMTPPQVIVDGHEQPNPYIERNRKTRAIESVIVRKIGLGFSPAGNLVAIDKTLYYNVYTYFIQAIQAKVKRTKWEKNEQTGKREDTGEAANPNAAIIGIADERPRRDGNPVPGSWVFFAIEEPLGIWANYEDKAIMECLEEHTQRQRFGDRIAQKIVERNILKDHPAIGVGQVFAKSGATPEQGLVAFVEVYGYRSDMGYVDLNQVMRQAARGDERLQVKTEVIKDAPLEEEREELADAADAPGGGFEPDVEPPADAPDPGPAMKLEPDAPDPAAKQPKREPSQLTKDLRKATSEAEQKVRDRNGKA